MKPIAKSPIKMAAGAPLLAAAGWIGYSALFVDHDVPLPAAIDAESNELFGRAGRLGYYVAGSGRPALLIHSVNAAASAFEMRPIFDALRTTQRVYALDLPGFGRSDRSKRNYTPALFADAVHDMIDQLEAQCGTEPIDLVALSLGAEFAAIAALRVPQRIRSLALISPTGLAPWRTLRQRTALESALSLPLWSQAAYDLLVSEPSIRYFLRRVWGSDAVDDALVQYGYRTSHQRGARHAPFAFLAGRLFTQGIDHTYRTLACPIWIAHGTRGEFALSSEQLQPVPANWRVQAFDGGAMPQFEHAVEFSAAYRAFLKDVSDE